ncbi:clathrin-coated vesicle protein [Salix suchowensis]|nr:clathrin-coated vesicle protein [Salix suchowensis]
MDGQTLSATDTITNTAVPRTEPTAFFYVVFGLVYEALATSSTEAAATSASTRGQLVIACLQALKYLATPEYCGKAVMEPTAFEELLNLCYHMAMTESANVQIALTDMLLSWASSQDKGSEGEHAEHARMLMAAFTAFATIAASIKSSQREDVRSVGILLYSELLKDESSEVDPVGPTLPSLKILLDLPVHGKPEAKEKFGKTVNALASACLLNIDGMRRVSERCGRRSRRYTQVYLRNTVSQHIVYRGCIRLSSSVLFHVENRVLGVFLPTILLTLSNDKEATTTIGSAASPSLSMHTLSIAQILSFAALSPNAFTQAAAKLDPGARESLEQAVRKAVGKTATQAPGQGTGQGGKPQILLRAF